MRSSQGELSDEGFWEQFWKLWANHDSRFQGQGLQISCKGADWRQACAALIQILKASKTMGTAQLDLAVARRIDSLHDASNPARGAWLSEMLCHYFPELYPINNSPVRKWLSMNRWRSSRRGASEGQKYTELAKQLRYVVKKYNPAGARNLAELDAAIWRWVADNT